MEYLKIFTDFAKTISPLSDAERGRLFTAMLEYASSGVIPEFSGNERFIWPTAQLHIDREAEFLLKQRENGIKGGRPKTHHNPTKPTETQINPTVPNETQKTQKDKDKDKDKDNLSKEKTNKKEKSAFSPPTVEMVKDYCQSSGHRIDAEAFVDWYGSIGWKVGNKPMKDWQAAVRNWERRDRDTTTAPQKKKVGYQPNWNDPKRDDWLKQINARIQSDENRVSASQYAREHGISYEQAVKELADG